jgi:hypothetical protein
MSELQARRIDRSEKKVPALWYLLLMGAGMVLAWATRADVLSDWDSWDYAWMALRKRPSGLCLGRWWFIFLMRLCRQAGSLLGLAGQEAFVAMQWGVALMSAAGLAVLMRWIWQMTRNRWAALAGGLCVLASPSLVAYLSSVMTEGPTLLFLALTLLGWQLAVDNAHRPLLRCGGHACLSGASFAVAVSMREPALLLGLWPILDCLVFRRKRKLSLLVLAVVTFAMGMAIALLMAYRWSGDHPLAVLARYRIYMRQERAMYGFTPIKNIGYLLLHFMTASPLGAAALGAAAGVWGLRKLWKISLPEAPEDFRSDRPARLKLLTASMTGYILLSWYNPNLSFNYRLLLPLAWALSPVLGALAAAQVGRLVAGWPRISRTMKGALAAGGIVLVGLVVFGSAKRLSYHWSALRDNRELYQAMSQLPEVAAIWPGPGSATGLYMVNAGWRPHWILFPNTQDEVKSWGPREFRRRLSWLHEAGIPVFVKAGRRGWTRSGQTSPEWSAIQELLEMSRTAPAPGPFVQLVGLKQSPQDNQAEGENAPGEDGS